jgi:hypothetical protein
MSAKALDRTREDRRRAVVLQWAAIALYQAEGLTTAVQQAFQEALRLDPLNAQIQHSFHRIQANPTQPTGNWQLPYPTSLTEDEALLTDLPRAA